MLRFFKFASKVPSPVPARETYHKRSPGKGWPEECPPLRAANAFGWDILATFDMTFRQRDSVWSLDAPQDLETDWLYSGDQEPEESNPGVPLVQRNAWFWDMEQELPHRISPDVYSKISNQVKVSTFLFLATDANELLYFTDVPNRRKPYRALSVIVDTDWYPASYPWHCVLELDRGSDVIEIEAGEPICRIFTVRRDHYFAQEMSTGEFERYYQRSQEWLLRYGREGSAEMRDITRTYVKQQQPAKFSVII